MGYIGNTPAEKYVSLAVQHFSTTATASYTLSNSVTNENGISLFINNVRQEPGSGYAYTAAGTALTLSVATAASDTMYCVYLGKAIGTITPPDGSVNSAKIVDGSVTNDDLAGSITSAKITSLDANKLTGTVTNSTTNFQPGTVFKGDGSSTDGKITLNCSQNTHGVSIQSPAHASTASYTLTLPTTNGNANELLKTDGGGVLSWAVDSGGGPSLGTNHIIRTNALSISSPITFAGSENGVSYGPISVSALVTVTSPSVWHIL